jgi:serine/threonine protein phosphatase PrpC
MIKDTINTKIVDTVKSDTSAMHTIIQTTVDDKEQIENNTLLTVMVILSISLLLSLILNIVLCMKHKKKKNINAVKMEEKGINEQSVSGGTDENVIHTTEKDKNISQAETVVQENRVRKYTDASNTKMFYFGMSVQGKSHIGYNTPCQDFHKIEILDEKHNIGIAVVSDGAGSAKNSADGSLIVCEKSIEHLKFAIEKFKWLDRRNLPDEELWDKIVREVIRLTQIDLAKKAKEQNCELRAYAATFLILFFTPEKSFFAHVGDGRAGVKVGGNWEAILTPHKGEEANQTVFLTNEILTPADLKVSGVFVPETKVINAPVEAFILMSDGCEDGMWIKSKKIDKSDGDFKYITLNLPFTPAIEKLFDFITKSKDKENLLYQFLENFNASLQNEIDDKTVLFGFSK